MSQALEAKIVLLADLEVRLESVKQWVTEGMPDQDTPFDTNGTSLFPPTGLLSLPPSEFDSVETSSTH